MLQVQDTHPEVLNGNVKRYRGPVSALSRIMKEQGVWSLWRGNVPYMIR